MLSPKIYSLDEAMEAALRCLKEYWDMDSGTISGLRKKWRYGKMSWTQAEAILNRCGFRGVVRIYARDLEAVPDLGAIQDILDDQDGIDPIYLPRGVR